MKTITITPTFENYIKGDIIIGNFISSYPNIKLCLPTGLIIPYYVIMYNVSVSAKKTSPRTHVVSVAISSF